MKAKKFGNFEGILITQNFEFFKFISKILFSFQNLFFAPQKLFDIMPNRKNIEIFNTDLVKTGNCIDKEACRQKTQNCRSVEQVNHLIYLKTEFIFMISTNDYPRKRDFIQTPI